MNKQELIKQIKKLFVFGVKDYIERDKVLVLVEQLDEPQKVVVLQFVADWYEKHKYDLEYNIWKYIFNWKKQEKSEFHKWMNNTNNKPLQTLANMHQFGYEIDKEKWYEVILCNGQSLKTVYRQGEDRLDFEKEYGDLERFTRKQLEEAGFGWVFDCPGIEVREVE
nr:DUF1642 domain-containing protein [Streptococcus infantis]